MALILFTGVPGMGKTALIVNKLIDEAAKGRKIFVSGIPELQIMHELCGDMTTWQNGDWLKINHYDPLNDNQEGWRKREFIPDTREFIDGVPNPDYGKDTNAATDCGAIIVVDECQRFFRPRPSGSKVPEYIQAFEVHRKQGLDFWLISQRPGQVDSHVRGLCEKHYGIWANWYGRFLYEWSQVHNIDNKAERDIAKKTRYKIPKRAFDFYKSAEVHVDPPKHGAPKAILLFGMLACLMLFFGFRAYQSYGAHMHPEAAVALGSSVSSGVVNVASAALHSLPSRQDSLPASAVGSTASMDAELALWTPVVPGRPETAPAFTALRKVSVMPQTAACLRTAKRCVCYSQQGTRLHDIDSTRCAQILDGGREFNPYAAGQGGQPVVPAASDTPPAAPASQGVRQPPAPMAVGPSQLLGV